MKRFCSLRTQLFCLWFFTWRDVYSKYVVWSLRHARKLQQAKRRRNKRYKNPQVFAQHCFTASFVSMFRLFHLAWSTCRATKTFVAGWRNLLRKVEHGSTLSNKFWLCCLFFIKLATCLGSTPSKSTNQRVAFLLTRNNCFCCATSWSHEVKNVKHRPKTCNETMLRDKLRVLYLVFRRLKHCATQTLTLSRTKAGFSVF